ncbi:MAG: hypothetical protein ACJAQ3_000375 [Planctomycetota bacterium]|jgi:hypothetical protein
MDEACRYHLRMSKTTTWRHARHSAQRRNGWTVAGLTLVTCGFYYAYWLYCLHRETPGRVGTDPAAGGAVALPLVVAGVSLVPIVASGVIGPGEVNLKLFAVGMAINFVSHLLYLRVTLKLAGRLAGVAEASGVESTILSNGRRDIVIGVIAIAVENIGLKSVSLLALEVPPWLGTADWILLGVGIGGMLSWSSHCLLVANSFASNEERVYLALGLQEGAPSSPSLEDRDSHFPVPVPPPSPWSDDPHGAGASSPGMIPLSVARAKLLAPLHFSWMKHIARLFRIVDKTDLDEVRRVLWFGDSNPAFLMSTAPVIVAAYAKDIDAVALLSFHEDDIEDLGLKKGDRLLSINFYRSANSGVVAQDLSPGPHYSGDWQHFTPMIADLLSDYEGRIARRKAEIPEDIWERAHEQAKAAMARPGRSERSGNPVLSGTPA